MELGESVAVAFDKLLDKEGKCDAKKPPSKSWKARINEWGSQQGCTGTRLYSSMDSLFKGATKFGYLNGPKPYIEKKAVAWSLNTVSPTQFPIQAHHLIPKNHLPSHLVCAFLAKGYTKHPKYQLTADTPYDTDHANNGYCLPYATPLSDWKRASGDDELKLIICFNVMELTGRQLHQGSHKMDTYAPDPADPDEAAKIHPTGYLRVINKYLKAVLLAAQEHTETCPVCKPAGGAKKEINPRAAIVKHIDQVSGIIKLLVDGNLTFISEPAHLWWFDKRKLGKLPRWLKK